MINQNLGEGKGILREFGECPPGLSLAQNISKYSKLADCTIGINIR
jgi:hypothetical protein